MKNIPIAQAIILKDEVLYQPGQIVSKTLAQNQNISVTLFAFDKNEEISTHAAGGDALVLCLEGTGKFTVDGIEHLLTAGEALVMPAGYPHAVFGQEQFKMLLMVAK